MEKNAPIACISLGADRDFILKHKENGNKHIIKLEDGSLVVMRGRAQQVCKHSIPKRAKVINPRISLTFRICTRKTDLYDLI